MPKEQKAEQATSPEFQTLSVSLPKEVIEFARSRANKTDFGNISGLVRRLLLTEMKKAAR